MSDSLDTSSRMEPVVPEEGSHPRSSFFRTYLWSMDHKMIAMQYFWTSLAFLFIGGFLAMAVRWQIGFGNVPLPLLNYLVPDAMVSPDGFIQPQFYNALVTMHATVMVFLVIMPLLIGVFGNFLIPLQIGTRDMAFPFFNALAYWLFLLSGLVLLSSFFVHEGPPASGWTAYAPLSSVGKYGGAPLGQSLWCVGIFINGLASIAGAFNYITTIVNMRAPGMTLWRMPLGVWSLFITAFLLLLAVPVLSAAGAMLFFDLNGPQHLASLFASIYNHVTGSDLAFKLELQTHFFDPTQGGQPLLWQHLFWFFGHPEVYIMILPAMGLVSDVLAVFARKPIFGYRAMVVAMIAIGLLGFVVWGHHMFVSGMNPFISMIFSLSTMVIAVPSAIKTFNWLGTIYGGSIRFTTPMCFALAFVSLFVIGGLSGIFLASTPVDIFLHHTYFVVAHIHYVLFGGSIFGFFAALYFWFPKMFGRMMNEFWGLVHFGLTFLFFNLTFFPMHNLGLAGMGRRWADPTVYEHLQNLQPLNQFISLAAFCLGLVQIIFVINLFHSLCRGKEAGKNPWQANTLEWTVASPPGHGNFEQEPMVYRGPYEYSVPGVKADFIPQNLPPGEVEMEEGNSSKSDLL